MEEIPLPLDTKPDWITLFKRIFSGAQGNFIKLEAAPTTGNGVLKPNQAGYFGTNIYIVTNTGTEIKITGSAW